MEDKSKRLDNTIRIISDILEENFSEKNVNLEEAYRDIQNLKNKRNIE